MTHEEAVERWLGACRVGVEIGAFDTPIPSIEPFYVDRFREFAGKPCLADYWGDACHLPFRSNSLDYVATSHVLEHVANPVAALLEWHRVLVSGGIIYMVVPDRRHTFDHTRELSTVEHMWSDYENKTTQSDGTHIDEFFENADWSRFKPDVSEENVEADKAVIRGQYTHAIQHKAEINMHFHVFEKQSLSDLVNLVSQRKGLSWETLELRDEFPATYRNGILLVIRVGKQGFDRLASTWNHGLARINKNSVVSRKARPVSEADALRREYS